MSFEIKVGDSVSLRRTFGDADVRLFADLVGDHNPVHLDAEFAAGTQFKQRIVHGMLVSSLFSTLLGTQLPGHGAIYMGQDVKFKAPVYLDMEVIAKAEVKAVRPDKGIVTMGLSCEDNTGKTLITGEAILYCPWLKAAA